MISIKIGHKKSQIFVKIDYSYQNHTMITFKCFIMLGHYLLDDHLRQKLVSYAHASNNRLRPILSSV